MPIFKGHLAAIVGGALSSVDAAVLVKAACRIDVTSQTLYVGPHAVSLANVKRIRVVGAGKASGKMAAGLEAAIGGQAEELGIEISGQVNVPDDKVVVTSGVKVIGCRPPGYNYPTEKVVQQTDVVVNIVKDLQPGDVCLALISGGGSALLELPKVPLEDLVAVSKALSHGGADIESLNTVRRCLSEVKAGGLARMKPSDSDLSMISMIISDVIGDDLAMVSSGPTVVDAPRQIESASVILQRYLSPDQIPESVTEFFELPTVSPETKLKEPSVKNILIGNNQTAVDAVTAAARAAGFEIVNSKHDNLDPCADVTQLGHQYARYVASCAQLAKPTALISGGEPTVQLIESPGSGGRNLQLTAIVLQELVKSETAPEEIQFAAVGTDGEDGSAPVAGGWFDQKLLGRLASDANLRQELQRSIAANDCYSFFHTVGYCVQSPADVQTNVCDLQIMLTGSTATDG